MVSGLGFNGITTMQEMTSSICSSAASGLEGRLQDTRDNKVYWVGKLKDNNCWMTQNLDLDLSTSTALTSAKSDVANWTPAYNTQTTPSGWGSTNTAQKSYNPGDYYYTTPSTQNACANNSTGLSACTSNGWTELTITDDPDFVLFTTYPSTDGKTICTKTAGSIWGDINSAYAPCRVAYIDVLHYHAGNYYSYTAATAGTAPSAAGTATSSICPKGWQLPTSNNTNSKSFSALLTPYGVQSNLTAGDYDIRLAPLYFVYGGRVYDSSLQYAGERGYYWSSTANTASYAYNLLFGTSVSPSYNSYHYYGLSVRCVAR